MVNIRELIRSALDTSFVCYRLNCLRNARKNISQYFYSKYAPYLFFEYIDCSVPHFDVQKESNSLCLFYVILADFILLLHQCDFFHHTCNWRFKETQK